MGATMITTELRRHRRDIRTKRRERGQRFATSSAVVYEGFSPVDGAPICAVVTNLSRASENRKTGDMAQMYILRSDTRPVEAVASGDDRSTCGDCPLRPYMADNSPTCYVNTGWLGKLFDSLPELPRLAPREVGDYLEVTNLEFREGAYGDPAMVPMSVRRELNRGRGTSYSHQWATDWVDSDASAYSMASVQTIAEKDAANAAGWRTYRVTSGDLEPDEILCPEITNNANCKDCGLCAGNRVNARNIAIRPI